jgi:Fur family transcriptional regulator, ferric uptake regulator
MEATAWANHALDGLRAGGFRAGGARRAVVEHLARQACCRSAQQIHEGIRDGGDRAGIASVYRALDTLVELNLVQRIELGDGIARYEPAHPGGEHHHHLVCDECGRVEQFSDAALEHALDRVAGRLGVSLETHDVVLRGPCDDCRAA